MFLKLLILLTINQIECNSYALRYWGPGLFHTYNNGWPFDNSYYSALGWRNDLGYSLYGKRDIDTNQNNRIECVFMSSTSMISCNRANVECQTIENLNDIQIKYDLLGIQYTENILKLYPKNFTEQTFGTNQIMSSNGVKYDLQIYYNNNNDMNNNNMVKGLMIKDRVCYNKLIDLFKTIQNPIIVDLAGTNSKISISGFVLDI